MKEGEGEVSVDTARLSQGGVRVRLRHKDPVPWDHPPRDVRQRPGRVTEDARRVRAGDPPRSPAQDNSYHRRQLY